MQPQEQKTTKAHGMDEGHRQNDWKKPDTKRENIVCLHLCKVENTANLIHNFSRQNSSYPWKEC